MLRVLIRIIIITRTASISIKPLITVGNCGLPGVLGRSWSLGGDGRKSRGGLNILNLF